MSETASTTGAREHARSQAGARAEAMPTVPASAWPDPPAGVAAEELTWAETVVPGGYASRVLARGTTLRLRDVAGAACAHLLLHNADQPWERLNVADTVKVPWQAYLAAGHPLLSDQGRVLATIVADDSGRHDALCGGSTARPQQLLAAAKHGLSPRDVPPSLSFFQGVRVDPRSGKLEFEGSAGAGKAVELRLELPLVAILVNAPHPLDPDPGEGILEILAWRGEPTAPADPLWSSTPELERAFQNSAEYARARGIE